MTKARICIYLACLILGNVTAASAKNFAILVGVNTYGSEQISPLSYAVSDVVALAKVLSSSSSFNSDDIFVLSDQGEGRDKATSTNIVWRLTWLAENTSSADTLILYFSGHGLERAGTTYLLTHDSDVSNEVTLKRTAISMSELQELVALIPVSRVVSFMDACRNDPIAGKSVGGAGLTSSMARDLALVGSQVPGKASTNVIFFSCSEGERSWEDQTTRHGFFTHYLIKGLLGGAADENGAITVNSLESFLVANVAPAVNRALGYQQHPWVRREGAGGGDIALLSKAADTEATSELTPNPARVIPPLPPTATNRMKELYPLAQSGNPEALWELGVLFHQEKDYREAFACWQALDDSSTYGPRANYLSAVYYVSGYGVDPDPQREIQWMEKAGERGYLKAQQELASKYQFGDGIVKKNVAKQLYWTKKAAAQDSPPDIFNLGLLYYYGTGVTQDNAKARYYWEKALESYRRHKDDYKDDPELYRKNVEATKRALRNL